LESYLSQKSFFFKSFAFSPDCSDIWIPAILLLASLDAFFATFSVQLLMFTMMTDSNIDPAIESPCPPNTPAHSRYGKMTCLALVVVLVAVFAVTGRTSTNGVLPTNEKAIVSFAVQDDLKSHQVARKTQCFGVEGRRCRNDDSCCDGLICVGRGWLAKCRAAEGGAPTPIPPVVTAPPGGNFIVTRPISSITFGGILVQNARPPPTPTPPTSTGDATLPFAATFDSNADGFVFQANTFRSTNQRGQASGERRSNGIIQIDLGGGNGNSNPVSGGYVRTFILTEAAAVTLQFRFRVGQSQSGADDIGQAMASVDGVLMGQKPYDTLTQIVGNTVTPWKQFGGTTDILAAGSHSLVLGGYSSTAEAPTLIRFDDVGLEVSDGPVVDLTVDAHTTVDRLDLQRFTDNIETLAGFGDRLQGSLSYNLAANWVQDELEQWGYVVERDSYTYRGEARTSMYVTKVGTTFPDRMFIISAHLDGRGGGGAADDDGSGCSLVLETARVLASSGISTEISIRMVFWNNEESGLNGSRAYANDRRDLQGQESPAGSGVYPEPTWLGIIQHDMILFDHGLPPEGQQIPGADADIEYRATSVFASQSRLLAIALLAGNLEYSEFYPAQVSSRMSSTDSVSFADVAPAVSLRENQRLAEIGNGAQPNWHQRTDVFSTYSAEDYLFGFNIVQGSVGTVSELAGLTVS
jgi:hypothetical protein